MQKMKFEEKNARQNQIELHLGQFFVLAGRKPRSVEFQRGRSACCTTETWALQFGKSCAEDSRPLFRSRFKST